MADRVVHEMFSRKRRKDEAAQRVTDAALAAQDERLLGRFPSLAEPLAPSQDSNPTEAERLSRA